MALDPQERLNRLELDDPSALDPIMCYKPVLIHEKTIPSDMPDESIAWTSDPSKVTCKECISWIHA